MFAAATLFLDVCVQAELGPVGAWPLLRAEQAACIARMFALAREWPVRQGGVVCRHVPDGVPANAGIPSHCRDAAWSTRLEGCTARLPLLLVRADVTADGPEPDRGVAVYVDSGCGAALDGTAGHQRAVNHLMAGVRDAVVFGAGVEHGMARAIDACLARRLRTHVALDAAGVADEVEGQAVVAQWKRRGVDVTTVAMIERMLQRN